MFYTSLWSLGDVPFHGKWPPSWINWLTSACFLCSGHTPDLHSLHVFTLNGRHLGSADVSLFLLFRSHAWSALPARVHGEWPPSWISWHHLVSCVQDTRLICTPCTCSRWMAAILDQLTSAIGLRGCSLLGTVFSLAMKTEISGRISD